jgi:hypothetical protein
MGRKVIYLPRYNKGKELFCADFPFLLDNVGNANYLNPDLQKTQTLHVARKFHTRRTRDYSEKMLGGRFQGANRADFMDATDIYVIGENPPVSFQTVNVGARRIQSQKSAICLAMTTIISAKATNTNCFT